MSFLLVTPETLGSAAADIRQIGSTVGAGNLAAAIPTIQLTAAAADEVSVAIAAVFGTHANQYQAAAALAATSHEQFARALSAAAASYAGAEASIDTTLRDVVTAANTGASNGFQTLVYAPIHTAGGSLDQQPDRSGTRPARQCAHQRAVGTRSDRQRVPRNGDGPRWRRRRSAAADGHITDVAYSSELAIEAGTLMSVNNPDPLLVSPTHCPTPASW